MIGSIYYSNSNYGCLLGECGKIGGVNDSQTFYVEKSEKPFWDFPLNRIIQKTPLWIKMRFERSLLNLLTNSFTLLKRRAKENLRQKQSRQDVTQWMNVNTGISLLN